MKFNRLYRITPGRKKHILREFCDEIVTKFDNSRAFLYAKSKHHSLWWIVNEVFSVQEEIILQPEVSPKDVTRVAYSYAERYESFFVTTRHAYANSWAMGIALLTRSEVSLRNKRKKVPRCRNARSL